MNRESATEPYRSVKAWMLLLLILVGLGLAKISYDVGIGPYGLDASFYFQLARNVSQGEGVVTNVSLYHEGLASFPQRMMIYPLWPLVLGYAGRVLGMFTAAKLLPPIFYILDLVLLYVLANRISARLTERSDLLHIGVIQLKVGHLFVLLLGLNTIFFAATSHPYTEGLAFLLAFGALLLLDYSAERNAVPFVVLCALACGLAFLARSQMIVLGGGIAAALIVFSLFARRYRVPTVLFLTAFSVVVLWWWYLFVHALPLDRAQIPSFQMWVEPAGWSGYVRERLQGIAVSFSLTDPNSYVKLYGPAVFLAPFAGILALWRLRESSSLRPPAHSIVVLAAGISGIAAYVSLNLYHETFFHPWLFAWRHGLPYIFLLLVAVPYLLFRSSAFLRWTSIVLLVFSILAGAFRTSHLVADDLPGPTEAESQLTSWLEQDHESPPVILTTHSQTLSVWTDDAYFHWTLCEEDPETTRAMLERLSIDYVVVYQMDLQCGFVSRAALNDRLEPLIQFGGGGDMIYVLRVKSAGAAPPEVPTEERDA